MNSDVSSLSSPKSLTRLSFELLATISFLLHAIAVSSFLLHDVSPTKLGTPLFWQIFAEITEVYWRAEFAIHIWMSCSEIKFMQYFKKYKI